MLRASFYLRVFGLHIASFIIREVLGTPASEMIAVPPPANKRRAANYSGEKKARRSQTSRPRGAFPSAVGQSSWLPDAIVQEHVQRDSTILGNRVIYESPRDVRMSLLEAVKAVENAGEGI